jgi:hypothetical protein
MRMESTPSSAPALVHLCLQALRALKTSPEFLTWQEALHRLCFRPGGLAGPRAHLRIQAALSRGTFLTHPSHKGRQSHPSHSGNGQSVGSRPGGGSMTTTITNKSLSHRGLLDIQKPDVTRIISSTFPGAPSDDRGPHGSGESSTSGRRQQGLRSRVTGPSVFGQHYKQGGTKRSDPHGLKAVQMRPQVG